MTRRDRLRVEVRESSGTIMPVGKTVADVLAGGRLPFPTVLSAGMLARVRTDPELLAQWPSVAPLLESAWNSIEKRHDSGYVAEQMRVDGAALRHLSGPIPATVVEAFAVAAVEAGLVGYSETVRLAISYLTTGGLSRCVAACGADSRASSVRLDCVKEGHVSMVIRVTPDVGPVFCLNVARDRAIAAVELEATEGALREWAAIAVQQRDAVSIAAVLDRGEVDGVGILATRWLSGYDELHVVRHHGATRLGTVREFLSDMTPVPAIRGRLLNAIDTCHVFRQIVTARTLLARVHGTPVRLSTPDLELNDGDAVLRVRAHPNGWSLGFVGASVNRWEGPAGLWPYAMALASGRDEAALSESARVRWGNPAAAVTATLTALRSRTDCGHEFADLVAAAALAMPVHHVIAALVAAGSLDATGPDVGPLLLAARAALADHMAPPACERDLSMDAPERRLNGELRQL
jgi:hypothetical protein